METKEAQTNTQAGDTVCRWHLISDDGLPPDNGYYLVYWKLIRGAEVYDGIKIDFIAEKAPDTDFSFRTTTNPMWPGRRFPIRLEPKIATQRLSFAKLLVTLTR